MPSRLRLGARGRPATGGSAAVVAGDGRDAVVLPFGEAAGKDTAPVQRTVR
jgi:hypothetical protein